MKAKKQQTNPMRASGEPYLTQQSCYQTLSTSRPRESQPVPDERYYTKTNFFSLNSERDGNISVADKFVQQKRHEYNTQHSNYSEKSQAAVPQLMPMSQFEQPYQSELQVQSPSNRNNNCTLSTINETQRLDAEFKQKRNCGNKG